MTYNSIEKKRKKPIFIFWHTFLDQFCEDKFKQIIKRQLSLLFTSKIINNAEKIYVTASPHGASLIKELIFIYDTTFGVVYRIAGNLPHGGHASTQSRCVIASLAQQVVQDIDLQGEPSCRGTACSSCRQLGTPCVHPKPTRDTRLS